ncbi:MAG: mechanosensitive ion channel family protein [Segniliparus sp.]|uniref:mechanosensitive ion channel family protein n=1 Tax=Segniliparus sp. TaxID=2804064 RepID=UPI003F2C7139
MRAVIIASPYSEWTAWLAKFGVQSLGDWMLTRGFRIAMVVVAAILITRLLRWAAGVLGRGGFKERQLSLRSEGSRQRETLASTIAWVLSVLVYFFAGLRIAKLLEFDLTGLTIPATAAGAGLGFGAQRIVQDLLSGFFIIAEKQYRIGDLVQLSVLGTNYDPVGTVEEVTLRVTKVRSTEGELFTVPNGQIVKSINMSKDWSQAVVDIPVPSGTDIGHLREKLAEICSTAKDDTNLAPLLRGEPVYVGVESIELDRANLRIVANSVPGQQFVLSRRLRAKIVTALRKEGIATMSSPGPQQPPDAPKKAIRPTRPEEDTAPQERVR